MRSQALQSAPQLNAPARATCDRSSATRATRATRSALRSVEEGPASRRVGTGTSFRRPRPASAGVGLSRKVAKSEETRQARSHRARGCRTKEGVKELGALVTSTAPGWD